MSWNALADFKAFIQAIGLPFDNTVWTDVLLQQLLDEAQRQIRVRTRRWLAPVKSFTETVDGNGEIEIVLKEYPVKTFVKLSIQGYIYRDTYDLTEDDLSIDSDRGIIALSKYDPPTAVFPEGHANIEIEYTAGYDPLSADPEEVDKYNLLLEAERKVAILDYLVHTPEEFQWSGVKKEAIGDHRIEFVTPRAGEPSRAADLVYRFKEDVDRIVGILRRIPTPM